VAPGMKKQKKSNNIESKNKGENKMISVKSFKAFDAEKYGDPWIAALGKDGKAVIEKDTYIGGYTGSKKGDAGELYIKEPQDGTVYIYGQKSKGEGAVGPHPGYIYYLNGKTYELNSIDAHKIAEGSDPLEVLDDSYNYHVNKAAEIQEMKEEIEEAHAEKKG